MIADKKNCRQVRVVAEAVFADIVLTNGVVYTADEQDTIHEAIAVKGDIVLFAGSKIATQQYVGPKTKMVDLGGKMVIPGLIDTHIHPPGLSLLELYEVQLANISTLEGYIEAIKAFYARNPKTSTIYGRGWSWDVLSGKEATKGPRKEYLDAITTEIPIIIRASDGHTLWVNSKALQNSSITPGIAVPVGGVIELDDSSGEVWGTLKEGAMWLVPLPAYSLEQYVEALTGFQKKMHSFGITSILCMASLLFKILFNAFEDMEKRGELQLRVRGAMAVNQSDDVDEQITTIQTIRSQYTSPLLQVISTKFFTDGVIEGGTSHLLEPYTEKAGKGLHYHGEFLWDTTKLEQAFYKANTKGLQIHVHSTGDGSTRKVLDALEAVHSQLPQGDYRNIITHLQLVDERDILRFKELEVIASVQPYWQFKGPKWWHNVDYQFLGDRANREFPLRAFFDHDIIVASSSDYPATRVPNPLLAIEIGVTRNIDNGSFYGVEDITHMDDERYLLNKQERATVQQMIKSFTINGAYALFMEKETGSIEAGKFADLVVLDQNLLAIDPIQIDKTKVVMTFFGGKLVYERP